MSGFTIKNRVMRPVWVVVLLTVCALYYGQYYNYGISMSDEGFFLNGALRILDGQVPFINFRNYPPALHYLMALVFKLFDVNLLYERLLWVFIISACVVMTLKLSRTLIGSPLWAAPPLLMLAVPGPWHKSIIPFLFLCASLFGYNYIDNKGRKAAFYSGAMAGCAFYFRFDTSFFILTSLLLLIAAANFLGKPPAKGRVRTWAVEEGSCMAGTTAAALPGATFLLYLQAKMDFFGDLFARAAAEHNVMGFPFPGLDPALILADPKAYLFNVFYYLPLMVMAAVLMVLVFRYIKERTLDNEDLLVLLLLFLGLFSYNQTLVRTDYGHLLQSVQIPYILSMYLLWLAYSGAGEKVKCWKGYAIKTAVLIAALVSCASYIYLNIARGEFYGGTIGMIRGKLVLLRLERASVRLDLSTAREVESLISFVRANTKPGDPILVLPYEPMVYFLAERRNPTYYDGIFPATLADKEREATFLKNLQESGVGLIVYSDFKFTNEETSRFSVYQAAVMEYIKSNYKVAKVIGNHQIYLRRQGP